ncbi:hypothetical protein K469DRAFT_717008 [Zopfia rhizophila CBS 207.26]|uniref:Uncharacterized protein n=1 Tax=Zopfia rhizophila CBS 207.26 TaxID=1314779 RepID=A0A6A6ELK9_9PEZI|nr:hypothetical protein K469DRAFT_717008 [Zopfia rhizophila CBS 207.26]
MIAVIDKWGKSIKTDTVRALQERNSTEEYGNWKNMLGYGMRSVRRCTASTFLTTQLATAYLAGLIYSTIRQN